MTTSVQVLSSPLNYKRIEVGVVKTTVRGETVLRTYILSAGQISTELTVYDGQELKVSEVD